MMSGGSVAAGGLRVLSAHSSTWPSRNSTCANPSGTRKWTLGVRADGGSASGTSIRLGDPVGSGSVVTATAVQNAIVRLVDWTLTSLTGVQTTAPLGCS